MFEALERAFPRTLFAGLPPYQRYESRPTTGVWTGEAAPGGRFTAAQFRSLQQAIYNERIMVGRQWLYVPTHVTRRV